MARKTKEFIVTAENRDKGKKFLITEMPARQAEEWAIQLVMSMASSEMEIPNKVMDAVKAAISPKSEDVKAEELRQAVMANGIVALSRFVIGAVAKVPFDKAKPLLDTLMSCIQFVPGPYPRPLVDEDVEEASTYFRLKTEAFKLHVDFLNATAE